MFSRSRAAVAALFVTITVSAVGSPATAAPAPVRLAGGDAVATAAAVARAGWGRAAEAAIVGVQAWTDALAASSLGVPVLLTHRDALPAATFDELRRLGVQKVWVVGGNEAIGAPVRSRLRSAGLSLVEVAGNDRYGTAAALAAHLPAAADVVVVSGEAWADAAAVGGWAGTRRTRLYLTRRDDLPTASAPARDASRAIVVGGDAAVGPSVVDSLPNPVRLFGRDRYETSAVVASWSLGEGLTLSNPLVAPGTSPIDALVAAPLAAASRSVVVLSPPGRLPISVQPLLARAAATSSRATVVGGPAQIAESAVGDLVAAMTSADIVAWVNDVRGRAGRAPVAVDGTVMERAAAHAAAIASTSRLHHQEPACPNWAEAVGGGEPRAVFDGWMQSAPHRDVLLFARATTGGAAVVTGADGRRWVVFDACG